MVLGGRIISVPHSKANSRVVSRANSFLTLDDEAIGSERKVGLGTSVAVVSNEECKALALVAVPPLLCVEGDTDDIGDCLWTCSLNHTVT